jgi:branched-chain amino acid transport system permease protein
MKKHYKLAIIALVLFGFLFLYPLSRSMYNLTFLMAVFINVLFASSLRLSLMNGLFNMSHAAFAAIGAYTSALLGLKYGIPFLPALLCGGIIAAAVGLILSFPAMRVKGIYFAFLGFAFVAVIQNVIIRLDNLTGGAGGLSQIPYPTLLGISFDGIASQYYLILCFLIVSLFVIYKLERSWLGLIWKGLGADESVCASVGIGGSRFKILAFVIGCFFGGIAGGLFAYKESYISPDTFGFSLTIYILVYCYVGGPHHFIGPIIGATLLTLLVEPFRGIQGFEMIFFAMALILVVLFLPDGLMNLPERIKSLTQRELIKREG